MKRGSTWTYVLYLGRDASGKKQQKWVGGHRTKKDAEDALTAALERMRTGLWVDPGSTTVGEYLAEWLGAMESNVLDTTYVIARRPEGIFPGPYRQLLAGVRWEFEPANLLGK